MWHYISLYIGAKRLVFYLSPRDSHVIIVSGCLILTAVNLIVLIRMAYITKRLVKLCKIYWDIWHRLTWSVCTDGRTLRHNQIFWDGWFTKFSYPWCSAARALRARGSSAKKHSFPMFDPNILMKITLTWQNRYFSLFIKTSWTIRRRCSFLVVNLNGTKTLMGFIGQHARFFCTQKYFFVRCTLATNLEPWEGIPEIFLRAQPWVKISKASMKT